MPSSSSTSRGAWGDRRAVPATTAAGAGAAGAPSSSIPKTKAVLPASHRQNQPQPIQRFSQYGARFKSKPKTGSGPAAPARSPSGLSTRGFFSLGGGGSGRVPGAHGTGGGGGGGRSGEGTAANGSKREAGGARRPRLERERERELPKPNPPLPRVPPRGLPLMGPAALAATINSTLTVTTGRAAGETTSTFDSSASNGSGGGGGGGSGGGSGFAVGNGSGAGSGNGSGSGSGGAEATSPAYSETWAWEPPETPPASMPNLHQSSGSEDPSGSEDDEGFGLGYNMDADYEKFVLQRRTASTSALKLRSAMASAPGGATLGVTGSSASRPSAGKGGAEAFGSVSAGATGATAAAVGGEAGAGVGAAPESQLLPPRFPRSMSVGGESGSSAFVQPSTAPPPLPPVRRLVGGADAPVAAPARSPPRRRPVSTKPARARAPKGGREEDELRSFFRDPRLETTLGLIRSGQAFCEERHIVVDFVRRAKPTAGGGGKAEVQPKDDLLRHALLLTHAALYLLEVEMLPLPPPLPPPRQASRSPGRAHQHPLSTTEQGDEAGPTGSATTPTGAEAAATAAAVGGSGSGSGGSSSSRSPRPKAGGGTALAAATGAVAGAGGGAGAPGVQEFVCGECERVFEPTDLDGDGEAGRERRAQCSTHCNGDLRVFYSPVRREWGGFYSCCRQHVLFCLPEGY